MIASIKQRIISWLGLDSVAKLVIDNSYRITKIENKLQMRPKRHDELERARKRRQKAGDRIVYDNLEGVD